MLSNRNQNQSSFIHIQSWTLLWFWKCFVNKTELVKIKTMYCVNKTELVKIKKVCLNNIAMSQSDTAVSQSDTAMSHSDNFHILLGML